MNSYGLVSEEQVSVVLYTIYNMMSYGIAILQVNGRINDKHRDLSIFAQQFCISTKLITIRNPGQYIVA